MAYAIPRELNEEMDGDPFYRQCSFTGKGPVQRHHHFKYAHRALNELWAILPLHKSVHDNEKIRPIAERLDWICLNRADTRTLRKYSKVINLLAKRERLNKKFGPWTPDWYKRI